MKKVFVLFAAIALLTDQFVYSQNALENKYDVKQYILDLQISNSSTVISGNVIINAMVTAASLDTFAVDLINTLWASYCYMVVDSVFINGVGHSYIHQNNIIRVPLTNPLSAAELFSVRIYYHGKASRLTWGISISTYNGKKIATTWSQFDGSKVWWPCKQDLADKADSVTFYITTNVLNKSGSNGLLTSVDTLPGDTMVRYKWVTRHPVECELISFAVGPYDEYKTFAPLHGGQDSVLLHCLLLNSAPDYINQLKVIEKTKRLIDLYSNLFCDYPFKNEKYGYSIIYGGDNMIGSMENQTMATIGVTYMDTTYVHYSGVGNFWITAHELSHQWFGDYVTCASVNDWWLNEGFASYCEYIALQIVESQNSADNWMKDAHSEVMSQPGGSVYGSFEDRLTYKKGAAIIHILRYEINSDSLFFAVLKNYLNDYKDSVASAGDFKRIAEVTTGLDFSDFFNQWYYGQGYPVFDLIWTQSDDTLTITSNQTTSTTVTNLFKTYFDLRISYPMGDTTVRLYQGSNNATYKIYFPETVDSIEFDPQNWLIQKSAVHLGLEEKTNSVGFSIVPNPAKDRITIEVKPETSVQNAFISVYNVQGQLLLQQEIRHEKTELDISTYAKGVYLIKLSSDDKTEVSRIVKE